MAFVPGYANDIFVSYSHIDNQPLAGRPSGWVDVFHEHLQNFVDVHVGRRTRVWRDRRLTGAEAFSDEIEQQLRDSAVLVSVLSPGYLNSLWCNRELLGFAQAAEAQGRLRVGNLMRVVKVLRLPVPMAELPALMDEALGTPFFRVDRASERPRDLLVDEAEDAMRVFLARVDDVAFDLARLLSAMAGGPGAPSAPAKGRVFVGWSTADLAVPREQVVRELSAQGWEVTPAGEPPREAAALQAALVAALDGARLGVQLLGARLGFVPEGAERSLLQLQCAAASTVPQVVWIAPGSDAPEARMADWLRELRASPPPGADLLEHQSVESLKALLLDRLSPPTKPVPPPLPVPVVPGPTAPLLYLVCDRDDADGLAVLVDRLFDAGLEVRLPLFDGDAETLRAEHQALLVECDAVLLWWGRGSEGWLRAMLRDLNKAFGHGRTKPYAARCLVRAGPADAVKARFRTHELELLDAASADEPQLARALVARLSPGGTGART